MENIDTDLRVLRINDHRETPLGVQGHICVLKILKIDHPCWPIREPFLSISLFLSGSNFDAIFPPRSEVKGHYPYSSNWYFGVSRHNHGSSEKMIRGVCINPLNSKFKIEILPTYFLSFFQKFNRRIWLSQKNTL